MTDWNTPVIEEFRNNAGKVGGHVDGSTLLLLHHKGARTGIDRVTPLMYRQLDGAYAVFGSNRGADSHSSWFHNLKANPETRIEVGTETVAVVARVAEGSERDEIWSVHVADCPSFGDYEAGTDRQIPVIILEPSPS